MLITKNSTVLFQGDSITDCGRTEGVWEGMGGGYAFMVSSYFNAVYPELNVTFLNRGIGGNRVIDLLNRWQRDCLDLKPDYVSILIGINDCWRRFSANDPTTVSDFKSNYRDILIKTSKNSRLILLEPFLLENTEDKKAWREDLDPKIYAVRELAREFNAIYIPLDGIFASMSAIKPPEYWAKDGVHPTPQGHAKIAQAWLNASYSVPIFQQNML